MKKLLRLIRYYSGPWGIERLPRIPKISIEYDGFVLRGKKVMLDDIISIFYRNQYSTENHSVPFSLWGYSYYEILTNDRTLFFYGEHEPLAQLFDQEFEIETVYEHRALGYFKRWKQVGTQYQPVSYRDELSRDVGEKLAQWEIQSKWLWIVLGGGLLLFILVALVFLFLLYQSVWQMNY